MKIGYHTAGLLLHDLPVAIRQLSLLGYHAIAIRPRRGGLDPDQPEFDAQLQRVADAITDTGVQTVLDIDAIYFQDPWKAEGYSLASPGESEPARQWIEHWIQLAPRLRCDLITFACGAGPEEAGKTPGRALDHLASQLQPLLQQASQHSVSLALRPRSGDAVATVAQFERLQQWLSGAVPLGLAADIGEMLIGGELPVGDRLVRNLKLLRCVYLCQRQADHHVDQPVGHGEVALTRIVSTLKRQDYDGAMIVRVEGHSELGLQPAREAIEIFRDAGVR